MKAQVKYNDDGEAYSIRVDGPSDASAKLSLEKDTGRARLTSIEPATGEGVVYGEQITRVLNYVESLDVVTDGLLPEVEEQELAAPAKE